MDPEQSNYQNNKQYILKSRQKNKDSYNTYQREYYYKKQGCSEKDILTSIRIHDIRKK